jgi:hypothetical protein
VQVLAEVAHLVPVDVEECVRQVGQGALEDLLVHVAAHTRDRDGLAFDVHLEHALGGAGVHDAHVFPRHFGVFDRDVYGAARGTHEPGDELLVGA